MWGVPVVVLGRDDRIGTQGMIVAVLVGLAELNVDEQNKWKMCQF